MIAPVLINKAVVIAAGCVGTFNFVATELLTQNTALAIVLSAISMPAAAYFAARPKIIAAQAAREAAERSGNLTEFKTLLENMTFIHSQEVAIKERQIEEMGIELKLLRTSKHNALGALQGAWGHIQILEDDLIALSPAQTRTRFTPPKLEEITRAEDAKTLEMVDVAATRIATTAATAATAATEKAAAVANGDIRH